MSDGKTELYLSTYAHFLEQSKLITRDGTDWTDGRDGRNAIVSIRDVYYP
jgi:hypothetical protein